MSVTLRRRPRLRGFLAEGFGDPVPWEQVGELRLRRVCHTGEYVGEPRLWIDIGERVDALDGLQGHRRDRRRLLALPRVRGDVGQLEELAARMAPAQRLDDRARLAVGKIEAVVAVERVGLQKAGPVGQMSFGMF